MKGFVATPPHVVDTMVSKLFSARPPKADSLVLDPGCGTGVFIEGIVRWCDRNRKPLPTIIGIESDPKHLQEAGCNLGHLDAVTLLETDFLAPRNDRFDYIVGNPPYVPITGLSEAERSDYRRRYRAATGRFDLYLLFFEQGMKLLKPGGRMVFITPEKFLYVRTAESLRRALAALDIKEIHYFDERTFGELVTYPVITTIDNTVVYAKTRIVLRDGTTREVALNEDGSSWLPGIHGTLDDQPEYTLADACVRISCGVATGADAVFVAKTAHLSGGLRDFAFPTIGGREITGTSELVGSHSMLVPYARSGRLLAEEQLGELGTYLNEPDRRRRLHQRTCVRHKPWYAFHENPPLGDILRPKILCKDITSRPFFVVDRKGEILPRHSVYYLLPNDSGCIDELAAYLNSAPARAWLAANCQRAANGFLRLQSHVLKRMPVSAELVATPQLALCAG